MYLPKGFLIFFSSKVWSFPGQKAASFDIDYHQCVANPFYMDKNIVSESKVQLAGTSLPSSYGKAARTKSIPMKSYNMNNNVASTRNILILKQIIFPVFNSNIVVIFQRSLSATAFSHFYWLTCSQTLAWSEEQHGLWTEHPGPC